MKKYILFFGFLSGFMSNIASATEPEISISGNQEEGYTATYQTDILNGEVQLFFNVHTSYTYEIRLVPTDIRKYRHCFPMVMWADRERYRVPMAIVNDEFYSTDQNERLVNAMVSAERIGGRFCRKRFFFTNEQMRYFRRYLTVVKNMFIFVQFGREPRVDYIGI